MKKENAKFLLLAVLGLMVLAPDVFASSTGLPWEDPLTAVVNSIKGPIAFGISVVAIVASGVALIFGAEISGFLKAVIIIALVISLIVFAVNILSSVFGIGSALIL